MRLPLKAVLKNKFFTRMDNTKEKVKPFSMVSKGFS
jgi:hypothetical protein